MKSFAEHLQESILDDIDDVMDQMDDQMLSAQITKKFNEIVDDTLERDDYLRSKVSVVVNSNKKEMTVTQVWCGYNNTMLDIWDIDLRYELIQQYLSEGYHIDWCCRTEKEMVLSNMPCNLVGIKLDEYWMDGHEDSQQLANFSEIITSPGFRICYRNGRAVPMEKGFDYILKSAWFKNPIKLHELKCNTLRIPNTFGSSNTYEISCLTCNKLFMEGDPSARGRCIKLSNCNIEELYFTNESSFLNTSRGLLDIANNSHIKKFDIDLGELGNLSGIFSIMYPELAQLNSWAFNKYDSLLKKDDPIHRMNAWLEDKCKSGKISPNDFFKTYGNCVILTHARSRSKNSPHRYKMIVKKAVFGNKTYLHWEEQK